MDETYCDVYLVCTVNMNACLLTPSYFILFYLFLLCFGKVWILLDTKANLSLELWVV